MTDVRLMSSRELDELNERARLWKNRDQAPSASEDPPPVTRILSGQLELFPEVESEAGANG
jgi:hypothetical protein